MSKGSITKEVVLCKNKEIRARAGDSLQHYNISTFFDMEKQKEKEEIRSEENQSEGEDNINYEDSQLRPGMAKTCFVLENQKVKFLIKTKTMITKYIDK